MFINIKLFLAGHPGFFFLGEVGVKGGNGIGIVTAVGGGAGNIHPLFAIKRAGLQFADEKGGGVVTLYHKTHVFLFAADKSAADVVSGVAEIDVDIVAHFACCIKRMLDQNFAELLSLVLGCHAKRPKRENFFLVSVFIGKPSFGVHDIADDLAVFFKNKGKLGDKIGMRAHHVYEVMLGCTGNIHVPKCFAGEFFYGTVVLFGFTADD